MWAQKLRFECIEAGYVRKFSQCNLSLELFCPCSQNAFFPWADLTSRPIDFFKTLCGTGKEDKLMTIPNDCTAGPVRATLGLCNGSGFHIAPGAYGLKFWASWWVEFPESGSFLENMPICSFAAFFTWHTRRTWGSTECVLFLQKVWSYKKIPSHFSTHFAASRNK